MEFNFENDITRLKYATPVIKVQRNPSNFVQRDLLLKVLLIEWDL